MKTPEDWREANRRHLSASLDEVRVALDLYARARRPAVAPQPSAPAPPPAWDDPDSAPALDVLARRFGLTPFERAVVLLCAGLELDGAFGAACASAQGDPARTYATFGLALAALPDAHWTALSPERPLRRWLLVEIQPGPGLTASPLRLAERVLHFLLGEPQLDAKLHALLDLVPVPAQGDLPQSLHDAAQRIAAALQRAQPVPLIELTGDAAEKRAIAAAACAALGLQLYALPAEALPAEPGELDTLVRLWERETALQPTALLVECGDGDTPEGGRDAALARFLDRAGGIVLASGRRRRPPRGRASLVVELARSSVAERRSLYQRVLGVAGIEIDGQADVLAGQFHLPAQVLRACCASALGQAALDPEPGPAVVSRWLWDACRTQARPRLQDLAQRLEPAAGFDDLVLPSDSLETLREVLAQVRQRARVYEDWGFAARNARGLGVSALFAGPSGTGKTMAAEVLAGEMRLDLYRVDLSQVVSKYIGETEKNLRRVFDAAEEGGAVLLFDEADALFGKRSEVKDSHDRYANIEVGYLLQRMESYGGLAILTTNFKAALDTAFLRRLRFILHFPFPDLRQRVQIWKRIFPADTPTEGLDYARLARLNVAGGNIRNIALNAAFLAADVGRPVGMPELLRAARSEYAKLEKPLSESEIGGWA